jgi:5'-nucleotidase
LEYDEHAQFHKAARLARDAIRQILEKKGPEPQLYNLNIPTAALDGTPKVSIVPMDVTRYGDRFERRTDPWGREYYWLTGEPPTATEGHETDLSALAKGHVTLTPLDYNMTRKSVLAQMQPWQFRLAAGPSDDDPQNEPGTRRPVVRSARKMQQVLPEQPGQ